MPAPRIVSGGPTTMAENPWQVSIQRYGSHYCGGTLIAPQWILTAAHCPVAPYRSSDVDTAVVGRATLSATGTGQRLRIAAADLLPAPSSYDSDTRRYDLRLVRLASPASLGPNVSFLQLDRTVVGSLRSVRISGWGSTAGYLPGGDVPAPQLADRLQQAAVPTVSDTECANVSANQAGLIDATSMVCAAVPDAAPDSAFGADTCQGDSGGPMVRFAGEQAPSITDGRLLGVTSFGWGCGAPGQVGVYAEVAPAVGAIEAAVEAAGAPARPNQPTVVRGDGSATVSFDPVPGATSYLVVAQPGGAAVARSAGPVTVSGLANGTTYRFAVVAVAGSVSSLPSDWSASVTPGPASVDPLVVAPTITSVALGDGTATIRFGAIDGAGAYRVESDPPGLQAGEPAGPLVVSGLVPGVTYRFRVVAIDDAGDGPPSEWSDPVVGAARPDQPLAVSAVPIDATSISVAVVAGEVNGPGPLAFTASVAGRSVSSATSPLVLDHLTPGATVTVRATQSNAVGTSAARTATVALAQPEGVYHALDPTRLLDTRLDQGGCCGPIPAGGVRSLSLTAVGQPLHGESPDAVVVNVTVVAPGGDGYVTVYPCGSSPPTASSVNYRRGQTIANLVTVTPASDGTVCFTSYARSHLAVDLEGWYGTGPGATFRALSPGRLHDTRSGARLAAGQELRLLLNGGDGAPPPALTAMVVNVTVVNPLGDGFVTAYPCGGAAPTASNLNYVRGQTIAAMVIVPVDDAGRMCFVSHAATDLVVDAFGMFVSDGSGSTFEPVAPDRVLDTRIGVGGARAVVPAGGSRTLALASAPPGATGVVVNLTAAGPAAGGYLAAYPCGTSPPTSSNLNYSAGQTIANLAVVALGADASVCITSYAATDVVVDLAGWFVG